MIYHSRVSQSAELTHEFLTKIEEYLAFTHGKIKIFIFSCGCQWLWTVDQVKHKHKNWHSFFFLTVNSIQLTLHTKYYRKTGKNYRNKCFLTEKINIKKLRNVSIIQAKATYSTAKNSHNLLIISIKFNWKLSEFPTKMFRRNCSHFTLCIQIIQWFSVKSENSRTLDRRPRETNKNETRTREELTSTHSKSQCVKQKIWNK